MPCVVATRSVAPLRRHDLTLQNNAPPDTRSANVEMHKVSTKGPVQTGGEGHVMAPMIATVSDIIAQARQ
jgi:hypothetical protein